MKTLVLIICLLVSVSLRAETVQVVETDRQGQKRVTASSTTTKTPLPAGGEQQETTSSRRDSSGNLVLERSISATVVPAAEGVTVTTRTERQVDVNGRLQPTRQISERTTQVGSDELRTERTIQSVDRLNGGLTVSDRELATTRIAGNTSITETTLQKPTGTGWRDAGRIRTTEVKAADGSLQREIIESGRPLHERDSGSIEPQRKIIETEITRPDGSKVVERQTFRRDVNGDWKPASFSTENGQKPLN
ncbi:MAG: hypothetical protein PCFJNLEI_00039 [Verrucomicrobiae bacterium]|nr:hypothetical protein [Verrucomicrobiae bacterium]